MLMQYLKPALPWPLSAFPFHKVGRDGTGAGLFKVLGFRIDMFKSQGISVAAWASGLLETPS